MNDSRGKRPDTAELTPGGGLTGGRAWVPGFFSVFIGGATRARTRGEQFLLGIALFVAVMVVMKFLGPELGLSMPIVKM